MFKIEYAYIETSSSPPPQKNAPTLRQDTLIIPTDAERAASERSKQRSHSIACEQFVGEQFVGLLSVFALTHKRNAKN